MGGGHTTLSLHVGCQYLVIFPPRMPFEDGWAEPAHIYVHVLFQSE